MDESFQPTKLTALQTFKFERVLNEDPVNHSIIILGTFPATENSSDRKNAVVKVEKTALSREAVELRLARDLLQDLKLIESTDIYTWIHGWFSPSSDTPDVKINIIFPATDVHIRKYTKQAVRMVRETPEIYERVVKPYIHAFPPTRTQWVDDILSGKSEADKVLHNDASPEHGFVLIPDMKWDLTTLSALYLVAIVRSPDIRSLRDLRRRHLGLLYTIRDTAVRAAHERWGMEPGSLRMFVHYQPSYYHFHVHVVNANYPGTMGSTVGQAHLLDDIISLLELDPDDDTSIMERLTFTYALGEQHGLFAAMRDASQLPPL